MDPKRIVFMNVPLLTAEGAFFYRTCSADYAASYLEVYPIENGVDRLSVVGHESTAEAMTELLGEKVELNRIQYEAREGDVAIIMKLDGRLPEGVVLDRQALYSMKFHFGILTFAQPMIFEHSEVISVVERLSYEMMSQHSLNFLGGLGDPEGHLQFAAKVIKGQEFRRKVAEVLLGS